MKGRGAAQGPTWHPKLPQASCSRRGPWWLGIGAGSVSSEGSSDLGEGQPSLSSERPAWAARGAASRGNGLPWAPTATPDIAAHPAGLLPPMGTISKEARLMPSLGFLIPLAPALPRLPPLRPGWVPALLARCLRPRTHRERPEAGGRQGSCWHCLRLPPGEERS